MAALAAAAPASAQLTHRYSFDGSGTTLIDTVGGANGTAMGGATLAGTGALTFDGVDDYAELPTGLIAGETQASFEVWYTWDVATPVNWTRLMDFGDNTGGAGAQGVGQTYLVISPQASNPMEHAGVIKTNPAGSSFKVYSGQAATLSTLTHIVFTYDSVGDTMSLYLDGLPVGTEMVNDELTDVIEQNNWLGRSQFINDPYFTGTISEFRIYSGVLDPNAVAASFAAGPDVVAGGGPGSNYCMAVANTTGAPGEISGFGSATVAAGNFGLTASSLPANQFGIFVTSQMQAFIPGAGGTSNGNLCLGGSIGRFVQPSQILNTGSSGEFSLTVPLAMVPQGAGFVAIAAGETWSFQAWHREPVGTGSNFTNGLEVMFQ